MHGTDGAGTLMSIRDAARASGLSPKALRRRIERGTLGSVLVGGRRRIPVDDLVRRGLVGDTATPGAGPARASVDDPAAMARRLRALESRVAALEAALDAAVSPVATVAGGRAPVLVKDGDGAMAANSAGDPSPSH